MRLKTIFSILFLISATVLSNAQSKEILARSSMLAAEEEYNKENYKECLSYLEEVETALGQTNSRVQYLKVKTLMALNVFILAEIELKQFFDITPENEPSPEKYDEMVLAVSKIKRLMAESEKKKAEDEARAKEELIRAEKDKVREAQLYNSANTKKTIVAYQEYISNFPEGKHAAEVKEKIAFITKCQTEILEYSKKIELNPKNSSNFYLRGIMKIQINDYADAIKDFNKTIEINSKDADGYLYRGFSKLQLNDYMGAIPDLNKAIKLNPKKSEAYLYLGNTKHNLKDYQGAKEDYTKSIKLEPSKAQAHLMLGNVKLFLKDYQGAIKDYNKTIEIEPTNANATFFRGYVKDILKDYKAAMTDYNRTIEIDPDHINAYFFRGKINQRQLKDFQSAKTDFERVIYLNTDSTYTAFSIFFLGNKDKALNILNDLISTNAYNIEKQKTSYYSLACLYSLDGNKPEAIKALTNAFDKGFDDFTWIETDDDLDNIKSSPEFKELIIKYKK
jgi:tetratricopeptide (TPR) repeat protein